MKLIKVTTYYPSYVRDIYHKHPDLINKTFAQQMAAFDYDAFGWADYWSHALTPLGYEVLELAYNVEQMQRAWAKESSLPDAANIDLREIILSQIRQFKPDILWFDDLDADLLKRIRDEVPSIKVVLGWVGSAIPRSDVWRHIDLVLSCAPESVEYLNNAGFPAAHLHHGFDPRITERLQERQKRIDFSFIGQLMRSNQFHLQREQLLENLASEVGIDIFSPSAHFNFKDDVKTVLEAAIYEGVQVLRKAGVSEPILKALPVINKVFKYESRPLLPVNKKLKPFLKPPVFGLEMFQVLRDSKITLNSHADSSPRFASNMRLFETTGVGTCMVVDWKENLSELFELDTEVVSYKTSDECVEKVKWLLDHPEKREEIAKAGLKRTMKDHTFFHRAEQLDRIIKSKV